MAKDSIAWQRPHMDSDIEIQVVFENRLNGPLNVEGHSCAFVIPEIVLGWTGLDEGPWDNQIDSCRVIIFLYYAEPRPTV